MITLRRNLVTKTTGARVLDTTCLPRLSDLSWVIDHYTLRAPVIIKRTYRFYPTPRQVRALAQTFGCCRVVYNAALKFRMDTFAASKLDASIKPANYAASDKAITALRNNPNFAFLREVHGTPQRQSVRHLDTAFSNFFAKRASFPTFKSKRDKVQSASYPNDSFQLDASQNLSVSSLGRLSVVWSIVPESAPSSITITKDATDRYFVTLTVETEKAHLPKTGKSVGLDLGIAAMVTLSDGTSVANPRHTKAWERKLATAQRTLARRVKGSGRYKAQRLRVARLHAHVAACRKDILNKLTTDLVRRFDVLAIEDLNVKGMVKNHCLAKVISDVSFSEFRRQLEYKCLWYGRELRLAGRFSPTSQVCSDCGIKGDPKGLEVRAWTCAHCGACHDRDVNAAKNILAVGKTVIARGERVSPKVAKATKGNARRSVNLPALGVA